MSTATRTDLGGSVNNGVGETLLSLVHLTDAHVLDAASPARGEWVELEAHDPIFRPLLHMHRPYDSLTLWALRAHVERIRQNPCPDGSDRPFDLVVSTGDNIDNAQRNELETYLTVMAGGTTALSAVGSAQDTTTRAFSEAWPFWNPDDTEPHFIARVSAACTSLGLGLAWTSVPGNHDLMRQGTALNNPAIERIAVSGTKSLQRPTGFASDNPLALFLDEPEAFSCGPSYPIAANPDRRAITKREWIEAHIARGALGYAADNVSADSTDTIIDTEHVRLVLIDTNHPEGDYQGSIGTQQLAWLEQQLAEVDQQPGRVAILMSHHGADTLINERGHNADRHLAADMLAVVHRHRCVVAWLVGHRHFNRIEPRPGPNGGFWEITTSSIIDWPSQTRAIELVRHTDGSYEIVSTMLDHNEAAGGLAALHHELAYGFRTPRAAEYMAGRDIDTNVRLVLPQR